MTSVLAAYIRPEDYEEAAPPSVPRHSDKLTDAQAAWLVWHMSKARGMFEALRRMPFNEESGAAKSAAYDCEYRVYQAVWEGGDLETAIGVQDTRWRGFAEEQQRQVDEAPKLRNAGGSNGWSAADHVWVSADMFADMTHRIRRSVNQALGQTMPPAR